MGAAGSATDAERFSQRIGIVRRWDRWELGGGVRQSFDRLAVDAVRSRRATTRPSAHLTFRPARAWTLQTLAAGECHTTKSDGVGDTCGVLEPTARFGASWRATPALELVSNVGRYVRVPTLGELFGTAPLVRGNAALLSETALATDVGVRIRDRSHRRSYLGVYLDVYGFARWSDDLIAFQRTSFGALTPFNVGSARTLGAELQTGARPLSWLQLDASATLLDPRDTTEDRRLANDLLPYRSRLTASGTVRILLPDMPSVGFSKSTLSTAVLHRASRVADPAGLIVIADQTTLDAELRTAIARWVFVGVAGRNLTDARQFDTVGLPLPGRSVHASVEMRVE